MEIREGIKYKYSNDQIATVIKDPNSKTKFHALFGDGTKSCSDSSSHWINDFKSGKLKLAEYPYEVGDWVYCTNSRYSDNITPKITRITAIGHGTTLLIHVNDESSYLRIHDFNEDWRPCFKEEIPKVVKEDMSYLIPILEQLNI